MMAILVVIMVMFALLIIAGYVMFSWDHIHYKCCPKSRQDSGKVEGQK